MAASRLIKLIVATLFCVAIAPWAAAAQRFEQSNEPISLKAETTEVDFKTGKTLLRAVNIAQGDVSIRADRAEATSIDFEDSRWEFTGSVKIVAERRGTLESNNAVVEFRNNRIIRATVNGTPAQFEQKAAGGSQKTARGRANQIVYEIEAGTVRFTKDAWLSNGANEISGPLLVYNIRQEKVEGSTGVEITIIPGQGKPAVVKPQPPGPDEAKP